MQIDISTPRHPDTIMLIDEADWVHLQKLGIGKVSPDQNNGRGAMYAQCFLNGKKTRLHRLLLPDSIQVDHINHNGLDNRRSNLRAVTNRENQGNRVNQGRSKYAGVFWDSGRWRAAIEIDGKTHYLGSFVVEEDASRAYQAKLKELLT